jgi:hypothetical protein
MIQRSKTGWKQEVVLRALHAGLHVRMAGHTMALNAAGTMLGVWKRRMEGGRRVEVFLGVPMSFQEWAIECDGMPEDRVVEIEAELARMVQEEKNV